MLALANISLSTRKVLEKLLNLETKLETLKFHTTIASVIAPAQVQEINLSQRAADYSEIPRNRQTRYSNIHARILYSRYGLDVFSFGRLRPSCFIVSSIPEEMFTRRRILSRDGKLYPTERIQRRSSFNRTENYKFLAECLRRDDILFGRVDEAL